MTTKIENKSMIFRVKLDQTRSKKTAIQCIKLHK
jgi:hypothetical protein